MYIKLIMPQIYSSKFKKQKGKGEKVKGKGERWKVEGKNLSAFTFYLLPFHLLPFTFLLSPFLNKFLVPLVNVPQHVFVIGFAAELIRGPVPDHELLKRIAR